MSKQQFKLVDISSSYDPKYDYFTLRGELVPASYEDEFILYSKIISYNNDVLINASKPELMIFETKDDVFNFYDGISGNGNINPDKFDLYYKIFALDRKKILNLKLQGPPQLSRKGGSFIVHQPEKSFIGGNKWKFGSISIESIVIRKVDESFEMYFNLHNQDFFSSIGIIEVSGKDWSEKTIPNMSDSPNFQISLTINQEIDDLNFDIKFMFFEVNTTDKIYDQAVPEPEIEQHDEDDNAYDEDVSEIEVGNTYDVCAYHKKSLTQVMQYRNKKTNEGLNIQKLWRNGNFSITIQNEEEKEYLQNCLGESGEEFDHEKFEKIEVTEFFDEQSEDFVFFSEDAKEKRLQDEFDNFNETRDEHISKEVFLENLGFEYSYSCFYRRWCYSQSD